MIKAIHSQHKPEDILLVSETFSSKLIVPDSVTAVGNDSIDNPGLKKLIGESDETEMQIFDKMKYECNRLYSFQNKWPINEIKPETLAEAGLFYLQYEDKVQCPFCHVIIYNWANGDKPLREHMKKSPKCPFLMGSDVGNIPLFSGKCKITKPTYEREFLHSTASVNYKPKHPRMSDVKRRLLTYAGWPTNILKPQELAECGLYYSGVADVVTCFFCGGSLGNWEPGDNPWTEHRKYFPDCTYLTLAKSKNQAASVIRPCGMESIKPQSVSVPAFLKTDMTSQIVEQALDIFPEPVVVQAIKSKCGKVTSLQDLCDDILDLNQKPISKAPLPGDHTYLSNTAENSGGPVITSDALICKICMDKERSVVFQPCGHLVSCLKCSYLVADCPVCRRPIISRIKTYFS